MIKMIVSFLLLSVFLFVGVNYALRPMVPMIAQYVPAISIFNAGGLAALTCIGLLFAKK